MMKHNFINTLNTLKRAITQKQRYCLLKNTTQNIKFLNTILLLGLITSFEHYSSQNIIIYLKFNKHRNATIKESSILSKTSRTGRFTFNKQRNNFSNFILDFKTENGNTNGQNTKYTRLLAKFR